MKQRDAIIAALTARGEKRVEDRSLSKYEKWTRTYGITRNVLNGGLVPAVTKVPTFFFVGRTGALRVGATSTTSQSLKGKLRNALILEGESLDK